MTNQIVSVQFENLIWWNGPSELPYYLSKIDEAKNSHKKVTVVGNLLWEAHYDISSDLIEFLSQCQSRGVDLIVFCNNRVIGHNIVGEIQKYGGQVLFVDYFLYRVYQEIIIKQSNAFNLKWNSSAEKFLMLTGNPHVHRVGLLWHLNQAGILKKAIWSFYVPKSDKDKTVKTLMDQGATYNEANQFIASYQKIPDNSNIIFWPDGGSHYSGIPYDHSMYSSCKFRVISETNFMKSDHLPWITEKTWLTIVNRCPFIMAGPPQTLDYLESLGFKTFREYLQIPNYEYMSTNKSRIDAIITNINFWLSDDSNHQQINQDVEHNFNHFISLAAGIKKELLMQLQVMGIENKIEDLIITEDLIAKNHQERV